MRGVSTLCIRPLWKNHGWNWQIGGTTCAINYYLSNVSSILCGVWGMCIIFELPEVQLIHQLVHPDDDYNSCSFFGNLFVAKHANLSVFWRVKLQDPHHFEWWKYHQRFRVLPLGIPLDVVSLSPWRRKFTRCYPFLLHSVWSDAPELLSCRTALFLFLGTTWSGLGNQFLVMDEIWTNPRHFIGLESAISLEPGRWTIVGLCRENKLRCQFESLLSGYVPSACG